MRDVAASPAWAAELEQIQGEPVAALEGVSGGDVAESYCVRFASGHALFLKHYRGCAPDLVACEARGLEWLHVDGALRVAKPAAIGRDWLALEWIESGPRVADYDALLGAGLATLHAESVPSFGLSASNWVGRLPQQNDARPSWPEFYRDCRLAPLVRRAADAGLLPKALADRLDQILSRLEGLVGPPEPPARLHGDLWSGNVLADASGRPCLIDPAVYGGHREMDLAMMRLFGGFAPGVFEAYDKTYPLAEGHAARTALYQIYPLLVHVCLFGASYVRQLDSVVNEALA